MNLQTPTGRAKLKAQHAPYFMTVYRGLSLGYRKTESGPGTWYARRRINGRYLTRVIGTADDDGPADGRVILDYRQAVKSLERFEDLEPAQTPARQPSVTVYTVEQAATDYLEWYRLERKAAKQTEQVINAWIIPSLGNVPIDNLTTPRIRRFRDQVATSPRRVRGKLVGDPNPDNWSEDEKRKRKSTANRVLTVLKAALNHAWREGKAKERTAWERVKPFHNVERPRIDYFTQAEAGALLEACPADFRDLVHAALLTGCRYGELADLRVTEVRADHIDLLRTKSSKPRTVPLTDEAFALFQRLIKGKAGEDRVFIRSNGEPWKRSSQTRPMRQACADAGIDPPKSFHILRHTFAVLLLRQHVPIEFVAKALGNSVQICTRHYAHIIPQDLAAIMRERMPSFETPRPGVTPISEARR